MNAQFIVESGIPIPPLSGVTKGQGANRRAIEASLRSMKAGDSFAVLSPHLTGEVNCVAANLGLTILIRKHEKAWRCWLLAEGTPPPKSSPPELPTITSPNERDITAYLERRGLQPEYAQNKIRFRHPHKLSRILVLHQIKNNRVHLSFLHPLPEFAETWSLSTAGELPLNLDETAVYEALDDFFEIVFEEPPPGSPPFDERMKEVGEVIHRLSNQKQRAANYELNYEDLVAIARGKVHEVYIHFGDKPSYDFQCLVKRSIERRFNSLLSKHYRSKCRNPAVDNPEEGAGVIALTDEMIEVLRLDEAKEIVTKEEWNAYLEKLTPTERLLMKSIIYPTDSLRADGALDRLRYERVKAQQPKSRLAPPKYRLRKLALSTNKGENELKLALAHLIETTPATASTAWDELVESLNG